MNRFFDISSILSAELLPEACIAAGRDVNTGQFQLMEPLRFKSDIAGGIITVPVGFISDLASIPAAAEWFMQDDSPRISPGAWVHDWMYFNQGHNIAPNELTREDCDKILCFEAMADLGASKLQQWVVYLALHWFGDRWKISKEKKGLN